MNDLIELIKKVDYNFEGEEWEDASDEAKDLIRKLLVADPKKRLCPAKALDHPWMKITQSVKNPFARKSNLLIQSNLIQNQRRLTKTTVPVLTKRVSFNQNFKNTISFPDFTTSIKKIGGDSDMSSEEHSLESGSEDLSVEIKEENGN